MSTTGDATKEAKKFEWKIEKFSLSETSYRSPEFTFQGESWYMVVYPNRSHGYMGLRFFREFSGFPLEGQFSFALKTVDGMKSFERHYGTPCLIKLGYKYDIDQWISRSEFTKRQIEFLLSGCLTVIIILKRVDFVESATGSVCPCCKDNIPGDKIAVHKKCLDKSIKCSKCAEEVSLQNWSDHECRLSTIKGESGREFQAKSKILQDLKQLFSGQEHCDVVLKVKEQEFPAHKAILAARSPVFASTFRNDMKEKKSGVVNIEDINPSSFLEFLCFLYCEKVENLSEENVRNIFTAADKYDITDLRTMCLDFMKENLSVDAFCETLVLALLHTETDLINACTEFFIQNAEEIIVSVKWQSFVDENPTQSNELFIKYVKSIKKVLKQK